MGKLGQELKLPQRWMLTIINHIKPKLMSKEYSLKDMLAFADHIRTRCIEESNHNYPFPDIKLEFRIWSQKFYTPNNSEFKPELVKYDIGNNFQEDMINDMFDDSDMHPYD